MSAAKRVRLLVAAIAVVAAAVVAGVVLATRQDPAQPTAQCKQRPVPLIVPGVPSAHVAAVRAAFAQPPKTAAQILEPISQQAPEGPGRPVQLRHRALLRRLRRRRRAGIPPGEEGRLRHLLRDAGRRDPAPAVLPAAGRALSDLRAAAPDPLLIQGVILQRRGKEHSAEKLYAAGRSPAAGKRRGPGCRGGRPLRRGRSLGVVLAARAARQALPAQPVRALPPRPAARVDRAARPGDHGVPARASVESEQYTWQAIEPRSCAASTGGGSSTTKK